MVSATINNEGEAVSFHELLLHLKVTGEIYLLVIRSSINTPTIFLKRSPNELRINNYNPACLSAWRANINNRHIVRNLFLVANAK